MPRTGSRRTSTLPRARYRSSRDTAGRFVTVWRSGTGAAADDSTIDERSLGTTRLCATFRGAPWHRGCGFTDRRHSRAPAEVAMKGMSVVAMAFSALTGGGLAPATELQENLADGGRPGSRVRAPGRDEAVAGRGPDDRATGGRDRQALVRGAGRKARRDQHRTRSDARSSACSAGGFEGALEAPHGATAQPGRREKAADADREPPLTRRPPGREARSRAHEAAPSTPCGSPRRSRPASRSTLRKHHRRSLRS